MKKTLLITMMIPFAALAARTVENFNDGWVFSRDQKDWKPVTIPHDWAINEEFDAKLPHRSGALPWKGVGYYRKTLVFDKLPKGRVFLELDGVMCDGTLYVNGQCAGHQPYGYLGFTSDLTPYLSEGANELLVRADTTKLHSRWYPGAGMYRNVRLITTDRAYLPKEELFYYTPEVTKEKAKVVVEGVVRNRAGAAADGEVMVVIRDRDDRTVAKASVKVVADIFADGMFSASLEIPNPHLWTLEPNAYLYTIRVAYRGRFAVDVLTGKLGVRDCRLDKDNGFFINGERVQLQGVDLHSDLGPVGMAFNRSLMKRQLSIMRDMGVNALRTSHNPPAPEVLDLCDEMGIFVWDECFDKWTATAGKGDEPIEEYVERQLIKMIKRDRNHPSVVVWSMGNEIPSGGGFAPGQEVWGLKASEGTTRERCTRFCRTMKKFDPTRPVGMGCCFTEAVEHNDYADLDFTGWNYGERYLPFRKKYPMKSIVYSESASAFSVAGFYADTVATNKSDYVGPEGLIDSYDRNSAWWSDIPDVEFERMERDRYVAGEFVWTGIDYLGEPCPYEGSGARSSYFGICDLLAFPKDRYYLYRAHWNPAVQTVHIVPSHWNFDRETLPVYVYANNADEVELFVNGISQGRRRLDPNASFKNSYYDAMKRYRYIWDEVKYVPGEVVAIAFDKEGKEIGRDTVKTAGEAKKVVLKPEVNTLPELDGEELPYMSVVEVTLADEKGVAVPKDCRRVSFAAEGPIEIVAVGNGNPMGMDCFKKTSSHPLHMGRAGAVVRRTGPGKAKLTVSAEGLESSSVEF